MKSTLYLFGLILLAVGGFFIYLYRYTIWNWLQRQGSDVQNTVSETKDKIGHKISNGIENGLNRQVNKIDKFESDVLPKVTQHGFHDNFVNNNKLLGWRYWYLKNKSNYQVPNDPNFQNIPTRHYLDKQENVENWFSHIHNIDSLENSVII